MQLSLGKRKCYSEGIETLTRLNLSRRYNFQCSIT